MLAALLPESSALIERFFRRFPKLRQAGDITLGVFAWFVVATGSASGQSAVTVDLSPMVAESTLLSPVDSAKQISVVLALPLADSQGAADFAQHVSTPGDPLYRHYLTPEQFAARYGANPADYAAVEEWAKGNGLEIVQESSARTALTVRGTAAQFEALFKTRLDLYQSIGGEQFYSASVKPSIPDVLGSKIDGVIGLTNSAPHSRGARVHRTFGDHPNTSPVGPDTAGGTGPGGAFSSADLRTAYCIPAFGDAEPQTVALFEEFGAYESDVRSDVQVYLKQMGLSFPALQFVNVEHLNRGFENLAVELTTVTDIEMVVGINPAVKEVLVYEGGYNLENGLIDGLQRVAADNTAKILNISYWADEVQQGAAQIAAENTALTQLAAQGITVLAAAGDDGAYGVIGLQSALNAPDPGSQPLVTCVGGTTLYTGPGEDYAAETVWNDLGLGEGATGGGISSHWRIPSYQKSANPTVNGGSAKMRNVPDVAAIGDPATGVAIYSKINGGWLQEGGTEIATPLWAGYISILNAGLEYLVGSKIGQFNPLLYSTRPSLRDILDGDNGDPQIYQIPGYDAGLGYDNCSGLGTPDGGAIAWDLLTREEGGTSPDDFTTSNQVRGTSARISWTAASGATGYVVYLYYVLLNGYTSVDDAFVAKSDRTLELKNLPREVIYNYVVTAVNSGGFTSELGQFIVP
ncbi:MAG: S53 family peptidase [Chthoniobacterales bacterium]